MVMVRHVEGARMAALEVRLELERLEAELRRIAEGTLSWGREVADLVEGRVERIVDALDRCRRELQEGGLLCP
jgi:hypothetical protein